MDKSIFLSMNGAKQLMAMQQVNANNLANANSHGYKADFMGFMAQEMDTHHLPTRAYTNSQGLGIDMSAGYIMQTGRSLDVALDAEGFIAINEGLDGGRELYTRRGDLQVNAQGYLQTKQGHFVLGETGEPIVVSDFTKLEIGKDGTISILPKGESASTLVQVDRIKLVSANNGENIDKVAELGQGIFQARNRNGTLVELPTDNKVQLSSGALEGSNVNATESMVTMIELSRAFEMQLKMFENVNANAERSTRLMRIE